MTSDAHGVSHRVEVLPDPPASQSPESAWLTLEIQDAAGRLVDNAQALLWDGALATPLPCGAQQRWLAVQGRLVVPNPPPQGHCALYAPGCQPLDVTPQLLAGGHHVCRLQRAAALACTVVDGNGAAVDGISLAVWSAAPSPAWLAALPECAAQWPTPTAPFYAKAQVRSGAVE
ncbi:MAG: hypothetical protein JNK49_06105, partial [Planctomycetes bacterium]|nr:hypothetical protein [Planctomycetota bacterium]